MKTQKLLFSFLILISVVSFGQNKKVNEQIQASKVAFITNELNLSKTEAEKFWPIYNTYEEKQQELRRNKGKQLFNKSNSIENLSEKEASALLQQIEKFDEEVYLSKKKFIDDLLTIIPASKVLKLKKADNDFKRKLLKQYRQKKD